MNRVQNIRIEIWKILKYAKLLGNTKYEQVTLVLAVFASAFLKQVTIKFDSKLDTITVKPPNSGHLRVLTKVSAIRRCPLYRGFSKN